MSSVNSLMPNVSAIITTKSRPAEVLCAIRSVLAQTYRDMEILVVVDGPEPETEASLAKFNASFASPVVTVVVNPINLGLAEARNVGVRSTTGRYVAFLDDDDEWLPAKIDEQVRVAESLGSSHVFVGCRFTERTGSLNKIWPESLPDGRIPFSEYLFVHRSMLLPSTFLISRTLMEDVPFTRGLRHIEDIDWMLRAAADPRVRIGVTEQILAIYNNFPAPHRESQSFPWYTMYLWSIPNLHLFTPLAYSCFITRSIVPRAKAAGAGWGQILHLFSAAIFLGSINFRAILSFFFSICFTPETKAWGRRMLSRKARINSQTIEATEGRR